MSRKKDGTAFRTKRGRYKVQITTKDGKRPARTLPIKMDGKAVTYPIAKRVASECQRLYDLGYPVPLFGDLSAPKQEAPTVGEYVKAFISSQSYVSRIDELSSAKNHILPAPIALLRMGSTTKSDIRDWVAWLKERTPQRGGGQLAPKTIDKVYFLLKKIFDYAAEYDDYYNPFAQLKARRLLPPLREKTIRDKVYPKSAVEQLIAHSKLEHRVLWALYFLTGQRANEVLALRWSNHDTTKKPLGRLIVAKAIKKGKDERTKTGATRFVPVHPVLAELLQEWKEAWSVHFGREPKDSDYILPGMGFNARSRRHVYEMLKEDCESMGIEFKRLHDTRHTFISLAADDGADVDALKRITHTSPRATSFDLYNHAGWERLCRAVLALNIKNSAASIAVSTELKPANEDVERPGELIRHAYASVEAEPYSSLSVDISRDPLAPNIPIETDKNRYFQHNAFKTAIDVGLFTGEAIAYSFLELAELNGVLS